MTPSAGSFLSAHHSHAVSLLPPISCAFQPIVDAKAKIVMGYEALVRGIGGESASQIINSIPLALMATFDEHCRTVALERAAQLGITCNLHLNLMPQSVLTDTDCLATTRQAARVNGIPLESIVIEVTEQEILGNEDLFIQLAERYRGFGMHVALDDFGSGYSGLNLLAEFQPDALKLDKLFARGITKLGPRQAIVRGITQVCRDLGIDFIVEGIETHDDFSWFCDEGVHLFQGYFFARPGFESLPEPVFPS